jgi:hypothetical protein
MKEHNDSAEFNATLAKITGEYEAVAPLLKREMDIQEWQQFQRQTERYLCAPKLARTTKALLRTWAELVGDGKRDFSEACDSLADFFVGTHIGHWALLYEAALIHNHLMRGAAYSMTSEQIWDAMCDGIKKAMVAHADVLRKLNERRIRPRRPQRKKGVKKRVANRRFR